jgi:hypothetical protein
MLDPGALLARVTDLAVYHHVPGGWVPGPKPPASKAGFEVTIGERRCLKQGS